MTVSQIEATAIGKTQNAERQVQPDEIAVRRMAVEFESLLLNQLTASLNPKESEDEEAGLFSNSGGLGLSRQMFSEQLAKTMSQSGGIGLADMIVRQVTHKVDSVKKHEGGRALAAAREIRADSSARSNAVGAANTNATVANEQYPYAIVISEAAATNSPTSLSVSSPTREPLSTATSSASVAFATRPRLVHPRKSEAKPVSDRRIGRLSATSPAAKTASSPRSTVNVSLHLPIRGAIRSVFGPRRDPINGRQRFHKGLDIAATRGTPIEAAASGTVVFAGRNKGYGNMVMIEHADGRRTLYAHAESLFVQAGDTVRAGQPIAAVGSTGHSTGPHLHFEVREGNRALNPLAVLANDFALARR